MDRKMVIFGGDLDKITDDELSKNLEQLGEKISINKYEILYEDNLEIDILPKTFEKNNGKITIINDSETDMDFYELFQSFNSNNLFSKKNLYDYGEVFLVLPFGIGVISKLMNLISNNSSKGNRAKIILYSYNNFFRNIINFMLSNVQEGIIENDSLNSIYIYDNLDELILFLNSL